MDDLPPPDEIWTDLEINPEIMQAKITENIRESIDMSEQELKKLLLEIYNPNENFIEKALER